ncbi:MAG: GtrA family protein [Pseudomonadota bacterium]
MTAEMSMQTRRLWGELFRYLVVGALNTGIGLTVILVLRLGLKADLLLANALGYSVGLAVSLYGNKTWTFDAKQKSYRRTIPRFLLVVGIAFFVNILAIQGLMQLALPYIAAQISGVLAYSLILFLGMKYYVF